MTIKEQLENIIKIDKAIQALIMSLSRTSLTFTAAAESTALKQYKQQLILYTDELYLQKQAALEIIMNVQDIKYQEFLIRHYLNGETLRSIAAITGYSYRHITKDIMPKALQAAEKAREKGKVNFC